MLIAYKERGRSDLRRTLGWALARSVAAVADTHGHDGRLTLVPMPSTPQAVRERGRDTLLALTREAAGVLRRQCGLAVRTAPALHHARTVADQAGLDIADRAANLAGAMRVRRVPSAVAEARVVLVDDIVTSGATLAEGARALRAAGVPVLGCATVAAARLAGPR